MRAREGGFRRSWRGAATGAVSPVVWLSRAARPAASRPDRPLRRSARCTRDARFLLDAGPSGSGYLDPSCAGPLLVAPGPYGAPLRPDQRDEARRSSAKSLARSPNW